MRISNRVVNGILFIVLWVLFAVFWGFVALQLQNLVLYLGLLIINSPTFRPSGWNSHTIHGIYRCGFFILGSLWLGMVIFTLNYLQEGVSKHQLLHYALHLFLGGAAVYLFTTGVLFVLG